MGLMKKIKFGKFWKNKSHVMNQLIYQYVYDMAFSCADFVHLVFYLEMYYNKNKQAAYLYCVGAAGQDHVYIHESQ